MYEQEDAAAAGALLECGCCCGDMPFEDMVQCAEGHLFCSACLKRYVEVCVSFYNWLSCSSMYTLIISA
jgi:hypothetical protein